MKTASAKAKGRRLQDSVTLKLRTLFSGILHTDDIRPQVMGQNGADVVLTPSAKNIVAFDIECKNVEKLIGSTLTSAIDQCEANTEEGRTALLIFKKNGEPERVILKLDDFINLVYPNHDVTINMSDAQRLIVELEQIKQHIVERHLCK